MDYWWRIDHKTDCKVSRSKADLTLTNSDLILCKEGCTIRKTWLVENSGQDTWPYNTKIVPETPNIECDIPLIDITVDPGDKIHIVIVFKVKKENIEELKDVDKGFLEFKFKIITTKDGSFGEPLRVYCEIDPKEFNKQWEETTPTGINGEEVPKIDRTRVWID